ncbi:MAG: serine/threonine-protein phosphatase [Anaerolineales bacterium]|nr:serine/threonine-protein phosphatase [Anaerolineales bacterium]
MNLFDRFRASFNRKSNVQAESPVIRLPHSSYSFPAVTLPAKPDAIIFGTAQSTGIERNHNEDSLLVYMGKSIGANTIPAFGMFVVADGMGGHRAGEIASSVSVRTVAHQLMKEIFLRLLDPGMLDDMPPILEIMREAMEDANRHVVDVVPGGGTTLTTVVMLGQQLTIGHVGDSRAYLVQNGALELLTRDHSLVERLRELGQLSKEEAETHPQRNVLYRAIGQGESLEVDVDTFHTPQDASLLLCSDGLWGVVEEEAMLGIIASSKHPQEACERLVNAANEAGGPDNITAVLVQFP